MPWRGIHPVVNAVTRRYRTGVRLTKAAMGTIEQHITRDPVLGKWFVTITPVPVSA